MMFPITMTGIRRTSMRVSRNTRMYINCNGILTKLTAGVLCYSRMCLLQYLRHAFADPDKDYDSFVITAQGNTNWHLPYQVQLYRHPSSSSRSPAHQTTNTVGPSLKNRIVNLPKQTQGDIIGGVVSTTQTRNAHGHIPPPPPTPPAVNFTHPCGAIEVLAAGFVARPIVCHPCFPTQISHPTPKIWPNTAAHRPTCPLRTK